MGEAFTRHSLRPLRFQRGTFMHHSGIACRGKVEARLGGCALNVQPSSPAGGGRSSTPRPFGSSTAVSGTLGRPVKPGDDGGSWLFESFESETLSGPTAPSM